MATPLREQHRAVLAATGPFALSASLRAMSGFSPCAGDQRGAGDHVRKAFPRAGGRAVVVDVGPPPPGTCGVTITGYAESPLTGPEAAALEQAVGRWLGLDDDL